MNEKKNHKFLFNKLFLFFSHFSLSELRQAMKTLGDKGTVAGAEEMIKKFDLDGDGRINYEGKHLK